MTPDQVIAGGGTAGLIVLLVLIANKLWASHTGDDDDCRDENKALRVTNADLVKALSETTGVLKDLRDQEKERLDREKAYSVASRRTRERT